MTDDDTRNHLRTAALPGWEWDNRYGITRGEVMIGLDPGTASIVDDYPETPGPRIPVSIGRCDYATLMTPEQMRDAGLQLLAVAHALSPFTAPDDHTRGLRDAAEFAREPAHVFRVFLSAHNGEDTEGVFSTLEAAEALRAKLKRENVMVIADDASALVERHRVDIEAPGEHVSDPDDGPAAAEVAGAVRAWVESRPWTPHEHGPIAITPQEPMPDPRVSFVLGLVRTGDLHMDAGHCSGCRKRIAEAAGVTEDDVLAAQRRIDEQ